MYRLSADRALVATVDFFTPIVDDPGAWGAIAAANALSDIYAMGGRPLFALNLVGWPREKLPFDVLGEVLRGAAAVCEQARCLVLGGHSVDDLEPKFGMCVLGEVHPEHMLTNAGLRPGHLLVLTKPLGTGILATALKRGLIHETDMADAIQSMVTLNGPAAEAAVAHQAGAATDITGFGLLGHLGNMVESSGVAAEVWFDSLPVLPGALELAARGAVPGGTERNHEAADGVDFDQTLTPPERYLATDAQTSGGLLIAVSRDRVRGLIEALTRAGTPAAAIIGRAVEGSGVRLSRQSPATA